jgi:hypothetical protein
VKTLSSKSLKFGLAADQSLNYLGIATGQPSEK